MNEGAPPNQQSDITQMNATTVTTLTTSTLTEKNFLLRRPAGTVFFGSVLAVLAGGFAAAPSAFDSQLGALSWTIPFLLIFCMLPLYISSLLSRLIAHWRHVQASRVAIWLPGLVYIPILFFCGYIMTKALEMPKHGASGSEYVPLALIISGVSAFWVIPLVSLIISTVITFKRSTAPN